MSKFKAGDRVLIITPVFNWNKPFKGTVLEYSIKPPTYLVKFDSDPKQTEGYYMYEHELNHLTPTSEAIYV